MADTAHSKRFGNGNFRELGPVNWAITKIGAKKQGRRTLGVFATLGRSGHVFRSWLIYGAAHMPFGPLGRRDTELVICRVAFLRDSAYELDHHRGLAAKAGLSEKTIAAVLSAEHGQQGRQAALLDATDELVKTQSLTDATYNALLAVCTPKEITALVMLVTHYDGLATTLDVLGTPVDKRR
ncbi:carboxymuconolactone decarboxylase family protein [Corynebacterium ulceribovis]|uniref:carboxymuconolactone decarboxylase family protein n=1 Tax=Corynebacterium ulceribovis TaxID=487732 RepID=UPI000367EC42|nr:carboxymuconolactone decarboxylase family protein [Corynebacterium ulceribovis]